MIVKSKTGSTVEKSFVKDIIENDTIGKVRRYFKFSKKSSFVIEFPVKKTKLPKLKILT